MSGKSTQERIMKIIVNGNIYEMTQRQAKSVLKVAKKQIVRGIYAVEKQDIIELKNEIYFSRAELSKAAENYKSQGFKVYQNR